jgi:hypothetical protein
MKKPDATPIREETKRLLKARASMAGLSLVDYLDSILDFYFTETDKGKINENDLIEKADKEARKSRKGTKDNAR